jgi:hypothetical protein
MFMTVLSSIARHKLPNDRTVLSPCDRVVTRKTHHDNPPFNQTGVSFLLHQIVIDHDGDCCAIGPGIFL